MCLLSFLFTGYCHCEENLSFELANKWTGADLAKWQVGFKPVPQSVEDGVLRIDFPDTDCYVISPPLFLNANVYRFLRVHMMTSKSFQKARVFWIGPFNGNFERQFSLPINVGGDWGFHTYIIDMSLHPGWAGTIGRLMIAPINGGGEVKIRDIEFPEYSPLLKIRSFLQEFFGLETNPIPPNLGMVFMITGPLLEGRPFNIFVYRASVYLFILSLILSFGFVLKNARFKFSPALIRKAFLAGIYYLVLMIFVFWMLIEGKFAFDDAKVLIADYQAMWGKTLDEKRSIITGGDFYEFVGFCDKNLPDDIAVSHVFSNNLYYAFDGWLSSKAKYYLFPKYRSDSAGYKLVFGPGAQDQLDRTKKHTLIAKFKEEGFIYKEAGK